MFSVSATMSNDEPYAAVSLKNRVVAITAGKSCQAKNTVVGKRFIFAPQS